jgi:hypothetical protein
MAVPLNSPVALILTGIQVHVPKARINAVHMDALMIALIGRSASSFTHFRI